MTILYKSLSICWVEFQDRGTLHIYLALWAIVQPDVDLRGTNGSQHDSILIRWLESLGFQTVYVQYRHGFLNFINGYVRKCSDSLDCRLSEHIKNEENYKWLMVQRLLCQQSPCVPEIYAHLAGLQLMRRTFFTDTLYAPSQKSDIDVLGDNSLRLYGAYLGFAWSGGVGRQ